jgi:hypothetical protein
MPTAERVRDVVAGEFDMDLIQRRRAGGWRMVAIEWERGDSGPGDESVEVPFGFRIAPDCRHLEEDPQEAEVLRTIMRMIVDERRLANIADELNRRGFATRSGGRWNEAAVFSLMPVLVDRGPQIFGRPDWPAFRL